MSLSKRVGAWLEKRYIGCFLAPALCIMGAFALYITVALIYLSLCSWNTTSPAPSFIGISNYLNILKDTVFWKSLGRTMIFVVCTVTGEIVLGFIVAYALNRKIRGLGVIRTLVIVPMAVTPVVAAMFWKIMYDPSLGPVNYFLSLLGIRGPEWLGSTSYALISVLIVNIWEWMPFSFLTITAGLNALPKDAYEAAMIDGATKFQTLFKLTIPMLKQVLLTLILLRTIDAMKAFDLVFTMTRGGPGESTQLLPYYIYLKGFQWFDLGYAAALSLVLLLICNYGFKFFINKTGVKVFYD